MPKFSYSGTKNLVIFYKFLDYGKYPGVKDFTNIAIITAIIAIMIICGREQSGSQTLLARQQMRLLNREKGKVGNTNGKIMGTLET